MTWRLCYTDMTCKLWYCHWWHDGAGYLITRYVSNTLEQYRASHIGSYKHLARAATLPELLQAMGIKTLLFT